MSPETYAVLDIEESTNTILKEAENSSRVAEFHTFVAQNAGIMVESDRALGYKAPFGVLMGMCAAEITEENVDMFFAEAHAMLARARTETEEKEEETEEADAEEESENKSEQKAEKVREQKESDNAQPREAINSKQNDPLIGQSQAQKESKQEVTPTSSSQTKAESIDSSVSETNRPAIPRVEETLNEPAEEIKTATKTIEYPAVPIASIETSARAIVVEEPSKLSQSNKTADLKTEQTEESSSSEPDIKVLEIGEENQIQKLEEEADYMEIEAEIELPETSEIVQTLTDDERLWETPEELFALKMLELEASENFDLHQINPYQQFELSDYAQESSEIIPELPMPIEDVERTILFVAESMEEMETEEAETAHQILNDIVEKVVEVKALLENGLENPETTPEVVEAEQELTEIVIQLFDYVGIEYTPNILDSCVRLVLTGNVKELIGKIEQEDESQVLIDKGTHEVIKQLLSAISAIKKTTLRAYQIGKSTLNLYSQQLSLVSV